MKKNSFYIALVIFLSASIGCSKNSIDKPIYGTQSGETFYKTDADIKQALTSAYLQMRITWTEYALYQHFLGDITTDDAWKGGANDGDNADLMSLVNFAAYPTNSVVSKTWTILYDLVNRSNDVIYYAPNATGDTTLLRRYINEAKLLRAFGYYNLVTLFGDVPLVLHPLTSSEALNTPRAASADVFKQIVSDLNDATALPSKNEYNDSDKYRVSKGFAYSLLGKTYMFQGDYADAAKALQNVVNSGVYSLLPQYGDNWTINNSSESVFEIPEIMTSNKNLALGSNVPHYFTTRNTTNYQGYGFDAPTQDLYDTFDPDDPRITYTFTRTGDEYLQDVEPQDNTGSPDGYYNRKTEVPYYKRVGYDPWMISYNIRVIRYSDVLLLYAEALNETGSSSQALTYLNQVRKRARLSNPLDPDREKQTYVPKTNTVTSLPDIATTNQSDLRQAIWRERRCELAMEGWRRDDLMRQKRFGTVMRAFAAKYNTTKGKNFSDDRDYLLPIPQNDIDYSNGIITQNKGY